jgi:hypothetical protein
MRMPRFTSFKVVPIVDEFELARDIRQAFVEQFGEGNIGEVDVRRYPGDEYFAHVDVSKKTKETSAFTRELSDRLEELGLRIGVICHEKPAA